MLVGQTSAALVQQANAMRVGYEAAHGEFAMTMMDERYLFNAGSTMVRKCLTRRQFVGTSAGVLAGTALASLGSTARARPSAQDFAGKTVTIATAEGEMSNGVEAQRAAFKQATGATIELIKLPLEDMQGKITADLSTSTGAFDVIIEPFIPLHAHAAAGFYVALDDLAGADASLDPEDFLPLLWKNLALYNGKLYGLPFKADVHVFFHRTDIFGNTAAKDAFTAKTGYELKVPETVDELVETARFFTKKFNPGSPTEFGWSHWASGAGAAVLWAKRLAIYGGGFLDENFHPNFNNDAGKRAMEVSIRLNECCPPDVGSYGWPESNTSFLSGKVAMIEQWPGLSKMAETKEGFWGRSQVIGKTGYAVPVGDTVNGTLVKSSVLGGWSAGVSKYAKDQDLAYRTVSFLTGKEAEPLKIPAGNDPCRQSTYAKPEIAAANPLYPVLQQCLGVARITADVDAPPVSSELSTVMARAFNRVWVGDLAGEEALTQVEKEWVGILKRAKLYK